MQCIQKKILVSVLFSGTFSFLHAQSIPAEKVMKGKKLDSIVISTRAISERSAFLPKVEGISIYAGKKTNLLAVDPAKANLAQNLSRTVFAQVPGLTILEMDGAGTQINIGSRGTDSHRSIEMNMRQNGYNFNSDMFGYPEAHYTPPMQGIQKIELVRGSAALQFGSQFGGMMNYVMKTGDTTKPFSIESEQTAGTNNFFNSFNAIGGKKGKLSYYAYYDNRHGDGWRDNAAFKYHAYYAGIGYDINSSTNLSFQFSRMDYVQQIAGGLTDAQFSIDAKQSVRFRNFFSPDINIPALLFNTSFSAKTKLQVTAHYLWGQRNSVQFLNTPNIADTVNAATGNYNARQVDRDYYSGFTTEARLLHEYRLGSMKSTLSAGLCYFTETTKRRQKGTGTTGTDFDLALVKPYGIDLKLHTNNYAAFAEDVFELSSRLSVTPGVRMEAIETNLSGLISNASYAVNYAGNRMFPLFGTGIQYQAGRSAEVYGNISQAYRPYLYANVSPADRVDIIDPGLKDSKGYDIDLGYRGRVKDFLKFDLNVFYLFYGDRVGQLTMKDAAGKSYLFTTNIGDAVNKGFEAYVAVSFLRSHASLPGNTGPYEFQLFNSLSYTHARYVEGQINMSGTNVDLKGKSLEGVPEWINRTGLTWQHRSLSATLNLTCIGKSFSDANNTVFNPTGATGIVPAYQLWDMNAGWHFLKYYSLSGGINNIANTKYFTRRINMYPGPGILPGDGRSFYVSIGVKI